MKRREFLEAAAGLGALALPPLPRPGRSGLWATVLPPARSRPAGASGRRRPHGVVARGAVRDVHPLGAVLDPRRRVDGPERLRRVDPQLGPHPARDLRQARGAVQSREVRRRPVGGDGEGRGDEVRDHHEQAPRRLLPVRQQAHELLHPLDAVPATTSCADGRREPARGAAPVLVPLHHGLAPPGLAAAARLGGRDAAGGRRAHVALRALPPRLGGAAAQELRRRSA